MTPEYRAWLIEVFAPLGDVSLKPMFGFYGIYAGAVIFGVVANERIYLKTDEISREPFQVAGTSAFEYLARNGERTVTSYWELPERLYDERDEIIAWARRAYDIASKSPTAKNKRAKAK